MTPDLKESEAMEDWDVDACRAWHTLDSQEVGCGGEWGGG